MNVNHARMSAFPTSLTDLLMPSIAMCTLPCTIVSHSRIEDFANGLDSSLRRAACIFASRMAKMPLLCSGTSCPVNLPYHGAFINPEPIRWMSLVAARSATATSSGEILTIGPAAYRISFGDTGSARHESATDRIASAAH